MVHGVFRAAVNGTHERGTGGFVYVQGEECAYVFPHELKNQDELQTTLTELLEDTDKASSVFYVVEVRDERAHLMAYPRDRVLKELMEDMEAQKRNEHDARISEAEEESVAM